MKPITIKEMADLCLKAAKSGYGDYVLLVSDDEECNGFHPLFERKFYQGENIEVLNNERKMVTAKTLTLG